MCETAEMASTSPVIVGTDLSESANTAIREAALWAQRHGAKLLVAHVAPDSVFQRLAVAQAEQALFEQVASQTPSDLETEVIIRPGSAHAELIHLADERRASLLVVGASGRSGLGPALFGTTAEQAVRYAHCPVLVTRAGPSAGPVLAATDLSENALPALRYAVAESQRRGVPTIALYSDYEAPSPLAALGPLVVSPPAPTEEELDARRQAAKQTLESLLEAASGKGQCLVVDEPPTHAVVDQAGRLGASLIVVGTRGRTGLARVALGSVAEAIIRRAPCSVLAVRAT